MKNRVLRVNVQQTIPLIQKDNTITINGEDTYRWISTILRGNNEDLLYGQYYNDIVAHGVATPYQAAMVVCIGSRGSIIICHADVTHWSEYPIDELERYTHIISDRPPLKPTERKMYLGAISWVLGGHASINVCFSLPEILLL